MTRTITRAKSRANRREAPFANGEPKKSARPHLNDRCEKERNHGMKEAQKGKEIIMQDTFPAVFHTLLFCLYTDELVLVFLTTRYLSTGVWRAAFEIARGAGVALPPLPSIFLLGRRWFCLNRYLHRRDSRDRRHARHIRRAAARRDYSQHCYQCWSCACVCHIVVLG